MALYVVATPIGNLKDITLRALEVLKSVDVIAAEDTRVTKKLLTHYGISKPLLSYRGQVHNRQGRKILEILGEGKDVALVSDAGTPAISDPGREIVKDALEAGFDVIPIPGPSALTAALSAAGVPADRFVFVGFPPAKKGRTSFFKEIATQPFTVVFYESPHRLLKTLRELQDAAGGERKVHVFKELTKLFETVFYGSLHEVLADLEHAKVRGEYVIVLSTAPVMRRDK